MTSTHPAVELTGLTKTFGTVTAVDGLSLRVQPGEVVAFLGPNGAGKTTTIDMLLGLARPDAGTVRVLGGTPDDAVARGRVAAVLQTGGLLKDLTVGETVRMTAHFYRHTRPAAEVLERAGIADIADRLVGQVLRRPAAAAALRAGAAAGPGPDGARRADHRHGRRGPPGLLAGHPPRRPGRPDGHLRHPLPGRGGRVRRPDRAGPAGRIVADGTTAEIKNLAAGRTVRATLPGADQAALAALPGVDAVEVRGDSVLVRTGDSDAIARHLLTRTAARDLEITSRNLEDAFLALTTDDASGA